jgi:hypothetical protein
MSKTIGELFKKHGKGCKATRREWAKGVYEILLCEFEEKIFVKNHVTDATDFYHSIDMGWEVYKEKKMVKYWLYAFLPKRKEDGTPLYVGHAFFKNDIEAVNSCLNGGVIKLEWSMIEVEE